MVDLLELSVSQWLLISWERCVGIGLNINIEDMALETLRRAKCSEDDGSLERLRSRLELNREVLLW